MTDISQNNKRIAKNTLFLYFRMFLIMGVSLYTSRVVLQVLGVKDYGLYNVIGGIIAMFGLLNSSMATATQRYLTYESGTQDTIRLQNVFGISKSIHLLIAVIIVLLGETVGLWFFYNKMNIPAIRLDACMWVYQLSIMSAVVMIVSVPYNAAIIAHERMSAFAYISILDVVLRLALVYILYLSNYDRLKVYAILMFLTQLTLRAIYSWYCTRHFDECRARCCLERGLFKEMLSFAGWSVWGNCAVLFQGQGLNLLLNMFFSPVVNAARAIAVQVQYGVNQFCNSLQSAINPQITKSYASGDIDYMSRLIYRSSKFSFLLLWVIILPVYINAEAILQLWLGTVPDYTTIFVKIMLVSILVESLSNPLVVAVSATGRIRRFEIVVSCIIMATLPVSYLFLKLGASPESVFYISLVSSSLALCSRFHYSRKYGLIAFKEYLRKVVLKLLQVLIISLCVSNLCSLLFDHTILLMIISCIVYAILAVISAFIVGLDNNERDFIRNKILSYVGKMRK